MMNIFKHKKILCAMLAVIMLVPCFTLTASAETTFRQVATYTSIWEDARYIPEGQYAYAYYQYTGFISYGKNLTGTTNNPYTDCFVRAESSYASLPVQDFTWTLTTNMQYHSYDTQRKDQSGNTDIYGGEIFLSKNDPDYGPVITYYRGPNNDSNYNLDLWYRISADVECRGGVFSQNFYAVGTASDGKVYLYGVND